MSKWKKVLISVLIILILGAGGFFYWRQNRKIKGSPDDYVVRETSEGTFVENKKAGLTIKIPEGWVVKKIKSLLGSVVFYLPETEGEWRNEMMSPPFTKGCGIETSVIYKKMNFEELKKEIKATHWGLKIKSEEFEEITVNNYQALKNNFDSEILKSAMAVYIPVENKLYDFDLYWAPDSEEICVQEFNKFLAAVSITPD